MGIDLIRQKRQFPTYEDGIRAVFKLAVAAINRLWVDCGGCERELSDQMVHLPQCDGAGSRDEGGMGQGGSREERDGKRGQSGGRNEGDEVAGGTLEPN